MRRLERNALLPFPAEAVCALVQDVKRYPEFLKWCVAARVLDVTDNETTAALTLRGLGLTEHLVTRNRVEDGPRIALTLVEGPFRHLRGLWTFTPIGEGCRIDLQLEFELQSGVLQIMGVPLLRRAADLLVDAFSERAYAVLAP